MSTRVVEFKSQAKYNEWLNAYGGQVKIINVSTTKRWSLWNGFLGDNKTYTVTYEVSTINEDAQALFYLAVKNEQEKQYESAINYLKKALALEPDFCRAHYNLACYFSRLNDKKQAFKYLSFAVENGYNNFSKIQSDPDLFFLRSQIEFSEFAANGYKIKNDQIKNNEEFDILNSLERLAQLKDREILSDSEFLDEKRKILDHSNQTNSVGSSSQLSASITKNKDQEDNDWYERNMSNK